MKNLRILRKAIFTKPEGSQSGGNQIFPISEGSQSGGVLLLLIRRGSNPEGSQFCQSGGVLFLPNRGGTVFVNPEGYYFVQGLR